MQSLDKILRKFIKDYGLETGLTLTAIRKQWEKLVGSSIASHTQPEEIKGRTIFVVVDTPQWIHHLSFYKQEICEKLEPYKITDVRFKIGRVNVNPPDKLQTTSARQLTEEDLKYIEDTVESLKDDELKGKFRRLLSDALRHEKRK